MCLFLLQESLAADGGADGLMSFLEVLLPKVLELLEAVDAAEGDVRLRRRCGRITHAASLLLDILPLSQVSHVPLVPLSDDEDEGGGVNKDDDDCNGKQHSV